MRKAVRRTENSFFRQSQEVINCRSSYEQLWRPMTVVNLITGSVLGDAVFDGTVVDHGNQSNGISLQQSCTASHVTKQSSNSVPSLKQVAKIANNGLFVCSPVSNNAIPGECFFAH